MASTISGSSVIYARRVVTHQYNWPTIPFNLWLFVMLVSASTILGVFASFIQIQQQLLIPIPWYAHALDPFISPSFRVKLTAPNRYFPYFITVASLVILFITMLIYLAQQQRLLPAIVMIGAFMLFILWLVGLIVVSIELWGPSGSVSSVCNLAVFGRNPKGDNFITLAWLEQRNICQSWQVVFAFAMVGALFLLWIMVMAYQVFVES
jgi:hypothetical protein